MNAGVRGRVETHEDEVVALREHVGVDLGRPLRGDKHVDPELPALAGDLHSEVRRQGASSRRPSTRGRRCAPRRRRAAPARGGSAAPRGDAGRCATRACAPPASGASRGRRRGSARARPPGRRAPSPASRRAQTPQSSTPRLAMRCRSGFASSRSMSESAFSALGALVPRGARRSSAYSSRSATGSRPRSAARARGVELAEAQPQARVALGAGGAHDDPVGQPAASGRPRRDPRRRGAPAGARSRSSGRGSRCAGRSRAGAARASGRASSSCPSPTARRGRCAGRSRRRRARRGRRREREVADREPRPLRRRALQPARDLVRCGRPREAVVEGARLAVEHDAAAAREPDQQRARGCRPPPRSPRHRRLARLDLGALQRAHLAERRLVLALEDDVAAEPQLEPVDAGLEREAAAVERVGERQDGRLDVRPQRAVQRKARRQVSSCQLRPARRSCGRRLLTIRETIVTR